MSETPIQVVADTITIYGVGYDNEKPQAYFTNFETAQEHRDRNRYDRLETISVKLTPSQARAFNEYQQYLEAQEEEARREFLRFGQRIESD